MYIGVCDMTKCCAGSRVCKLRLLQSFTFGILPVLSSDWLCEDCRDNSTSQVTEAASNENKLSESRENEVTLLSVQHNYDTELALPGLSCGIPCSCHLSSVGCENRTEEYLGIFRWDWICGFIVGLKI